MRISFRHSFNSLGMQYCAWCLQASLHAVHPRVGLQPGPQLMEREPTQRKEHQVGDTVCAVGQTEELADRTVQVPYSGWT